MQKQPTADKLRLDMALVRLAYRTPTPRSLILPPVRGRNRYRRDKRGFSTAVCTVCVLGLLVATVAFMLVEILQAPPPARAKKPAPPNVLDVARQLDEYVGKPKPWTREELIDLETTVVNLISELP